MREKLYHIIFESDTPAGKAFDVILLIAILLSILAVMLESVQDIRRQYSEELIAIEWAFTILFTVEYGLRIYSARRRWHYIRSFYGIIDFIAIIPTYLTLLVAGAQYVMVVRGLRLLRIFRILKLAHFLGEAETLKRALKNSVAKITIFIGAIVIVIFIIAATMYMIEGPENGFTSIPMSVYWAIVTLTTVGYGDIVPQTVVGKALASMLMILGYGIIAVPTGIMSSEITKADAEQIRQGNSRKNPSPAKRPPAGKVCNTCKPHIVNLDK